MIHGRRKWRQFISWDTHGILCRIFRSIGGVLDISGLSTYPISKWLGMVSGYWMLLVHLPRNENMRDFITLGMIDEIPKCFRKNNPNVPNHKPDLVASQLQFVGSPQNSLVDSGDWRQATSVFRLHPSATVHWHGHASTGDSTSC